MNERVSKETCIVLDERPFRRLIKPTSSPRKTQAILDIVNGKLPARLVASFELWPEYIGLGRPAFRHQDDFPPFSSLSSIEELNGTVSQAINSLICSYEIDPLLDPAGLEARVSQFMDMRVSKDVPDAYHIAHDILYFKGQDFNGESFSFSAISHQLAISYAVDELFFLVRFFPASFFEAVEIFTHQLTTTLREYAHLPVFRLVDSIVESLWKYHSALPGNAGADAQKTIRNAGQGLRELRDSEFADCFYLWAAVQGIFSSSGLDPAIVITIDTACRRRLEILIDLLTAKLAGTRLLSALNEDGDLRPGRILVLSDDSCEIKEEIDVQALVEEKLQKIILEDHPK